MPYAPNTQYRGDAYLSQGIQQAGQGLAQAITDFRKAKEESGFLDEQVVGLAAAAKPLIEAGQLDVGLADQLAKFPELSLSKKRGVAASALFQIQQAQAQQRDAADNEDRALRRSMEHGRLTMEAERFNRESADRGRRQQFNVGLSDYLNTPESIRRPVREAVPAIAAQAGIATPEMVGDLEDARLRDVELGIRDRAVGVQERNAGVAEGKLGVLESTTGEMKPESVQRMMNDILLRLTDPLRAPDERSEKALRDRLKELQQMAGGQPAESEGAHGTAGGSAGVIKKVRVQAPDGRRGMIPESQLEAALKKGYKRVAD